jgi:hypothetical protein
LSAEQWDRVSHGFVRDRGPEDCRIFYRHFVAAQRPWSLEESAKLSALAATHKGHNVRGEGKREGAWVHGYMADEGVEGCCTSQTPKPPYLVCSGSRGLQHVADPQPLFPCVQWE